MRLRTLGNACCGIKEKQMINVISIRILDPMLWVPQTSALLPAKQEAVFHQTV